MTEQLSTRQFDLLGLAVGCALLPHLQRLPGWLAVALVVIVAVRVILRRRGLGAAARWIRLPLTIALVALTWHEYGNVFGRDAGAALATGLLALKLIETEKTRDARVGLGFDRDRAGISGVDRRHRGTGRVAARAIASGTTELGHVQTGVDLVRCRRAVGARWLCIDSTIVIAAMGDAIRPESAHRPQRRDEARFDDRSADRRKPGNAGRV